MTLIAIIGWLLAIIAGSTAAYFVARNKSYGAQQSLLQESQQRAATAENRTAALQALLEQSNTEVERLRNEGMALTEQVTTLTAANATAQANLATAAEVQERMQADREELREKFQNLANQIFEQKQDANRASIQQLLEPLKQQIETFRTRIDEVHTADTQQSAELKTELTQLHTLNTQLQQEAETLARALKNEPQTRGRWGELILERTMEIAGLLKGRDYRTQVTEGSNRLDAVVDLPDGRCIVIDSKVPLNDYTAYCDSLTDGDREKCLKAHVAAVRGFIDELSRKDYTSLLGGKAPDFTIMLIPIEPAFGSAFKADGTLMEYALNQRIIPTSTASLVATLRVVENLWKIDAQNKNVQDIAAEGTKLLQYIQVFVEELTAVGAALTKAKDVHDRAVQRITSGGQGSILRTSDRLKELGVKMLSGGSRKRSKVGQTTTQSGEPQEVPEDIVTEVNVEQTAPEGTANPVAAPEEPLQS